MLRGLPHYTRIQCGYDQMWEKGRLEIASGDVDTDPVLDATSHRWGVSIIHLLV